jgi:hypothetical protein
MTTTPEHETMSPEQARAEVALDLQGALRNMYGRVREAETSAEQFEESARRERAVAAEYRAKIPALSEYMETLGIEIPAEPDDAALA